MVFQVTMVPHACVYAPRRPTDVCVAAVKEDEVGIKMQCIAAWVHQVVQAGRAQSSLASSVSFTLKLCCLFA